ncbi:hypothetical protein [Streptomyces sp. NPDC101455]|uniref:hypothetical protein n=1 Tax=Streptomyces sp. NPDC101455 TaxID=3366142 RepID=UPI0038047344
MSHFRTPPLGAERPHTAPDPNIPRLGSPGQFSDPVGRRVVAEPRTNSRSPGASRALSVGAVGAVSAVVPDTGSAAASSRLRFFGARERRRSGTAT